MFTIILTGSINNTCTHLLLTPKEGLFQHSDWQMLSEVLWAHETCRNTQSLKRTDSPALAPYPGTTWCCEHNALLTGWFTFINVRIYWSNLKDEMGLTWATQRENIKCMHNFSFKSSWVETTSEACAYVTLAKILLWIIENSRMREALWGGGGRKD
jgi:hypothetical protein